MRILRPVAATILVVLLGACGSGDDVGPAVGDYFTQLQRVSETGQIQQRGLQRDLRRRLEGASEGEDRMAVLMVYIDQSTRLAQDVVDALGQLEPPEELAASQRAYQDAWRSQLAVAAGVRDAGFTGAAEILEALQPAFGNAAAETKARCDDLQAAVAANGSDVDLVCDGRAA
ncbi:MAG TPA: hypothetical protein VFZ75_11675 [Actinomycetota bacterium]|nr:hypothetical protein [Actinomycetota bacterium]